MTSGFISDEVTPSSIETHRCAGSEAGRWSPWSPACIVATEKQAG